MVTLKFESYSQMIECYEHLESMIAAFQSMQYRKARCLHDIHFWKVSLPKYFNVLTSQTHFWQTCSISEELFLKYVDTGDIILFRCRGNGMNFMGPQITRTVTGSPFDHIAIILRFGD